MQYSLIPSLHADKRVTDRRQLTNNSLDKVQHRCYRTLKCPTAAPSSLAASENYLPQTGGDRLMCTWLRARLIRVQWSGPISVPSRPAVTLNLKNNNNHPGGATWAGSNDCLATPTPVTVSQGVQRLPPQSSRPIGFRVTRPVSSRTPCCLLPEPSPWGLCPPSVQLNESGWKRQPDFQVCKRSRL